MYIRPSLCKSHVDLHSENPKLLSKQENSLLLLYQAHVLLEKRVFAARYMLRRTHRFHEADSCHVDDV